MRQFLMMLSCLFGMSVSAQIISHNFHDISLSDALLYIQEQTTSYDIIFIYNDLEDFRITTDIRDKSVPDAVPLLVGFYPVRVTMSGKREIYVECIHKTERHLTGSIVDEQGRPVAYANIAILNPADSTLLSGGVTTESGYFAVPFEKRRGGNDTDEKQDEVLARISYVGYKTVYRLCNNPKVGTIQMEPETYTIKDVTVRGQVPILWREAGNIIFDTRHVVGAISASDLLRFTPGVIIEDEGINLFGTNNVIFRIDGREQHVSIRELFLILKSYPAADVERIEIMQNPSAKYSAEGNAGVINIVLKRHGNDYIGGSAGYALTKYEECGNEANANIIYNKGKLSTTLNFAGTWDNSCYLETNKINFTDYLRHHADNGRISKDSYALQWQADYRATARLNLGTYVMFMDGERHLAIDGLYDFQPKTLLSLNSIDTQTRRKEYTRSCAVNINASQTTGSGGAKIDYNLDYYRMRMSDTRHSIGNQLMTGNSLADFISSDSTDFYYQNSIAHNVDNYSAKIDVSCSDFKFGSQYVYTKSHRDLDVLGSLITYSKASASYDERIWSGYLEYGRTIGGTWSVNLGGRYEYTWTKVRSMPTAYSKFTGYGKLFPIFRVGYNPSLLHVFNWSFSSRVTRPNILNLNPHRVCKDVNHTSFGNQNLKPSCLYKAMMDYSYKGVLNLEVYYTYESDRIDAVYSVNRQEIVNSWDNITNEHRLGINSYWTYDRLHWMTVTLTQGVWYSRTIRPQKEIIPGVVRRYMHPEARHFSYMGMLQTTFFLDRDRKWTANLKASYNSPEKDVAKELDERYIVDAGLQYRFWKDCLTIGLTCRNLLSSHIKGIEYLGTKTMEFDNKFNYRQLHLSLTYNWGARLLHNQRRYESDEMQKRITNDF